MKCGLQSETASKIGSTKPNKLKPNLKMENRMTDWRKSLYECLKDFDAPRLLSNMELQSFASNNGIDVSPRQIQIFIERMKDLDILSPVRRGLYLNNRAWPAPTYAEAANRV